MRARFFSIVVVIALTTAACGGAEATSNTVPVETSPPTSPAAPDADTSTIATTTEPAVEVFVTVADAPGDLQDQVAGLYAVAAGSEESPSAPPWVLETIAGSADPGLVRELTFTSATVAGETAAVITDGQDIVLATSADGAAWRIVGAKLASLGLAPSYGGGLRQLYIIGSDARPGENPLRFRADAHHIITIEPDGSAASMVGIPRDSYVETPEGTFDKFTNVMASNGPERVVETAEILTDIALEGYVVTGFKGFTGLVNAFGGFDVDIPFGMAEPKSNAYFSAGVQHLTGEEALAFARNRTISGGDFTRQLHHGVIMQWAMVAVQARGIEALPEMLEMLTTYAWTDLSAGDLLTFGALVYELEPFEVPNIVVEGENGSRNGAAVVILSPSAAEVFEGLRTAPYGG